MPKREKKRLYKSDWRLLDYTICILVVFAWNTRLEKTDTEKEK